MFSISGYVLISIIFNVTLCGKDNNLLLEIYNTIQQHISPSLYSSLTPTLMGI